MIRDRAGVTFTLCAAGLIGLWLMYREPSPNNGGVSAATAQLQDSLAFTAPRHDSAVTQLVRADTRLARSDSQLARAAARSQARADRERERADSIAAEAKLAAGDAEAWRLAHEARLQETIALRHTNDTLRLRIDTVRAARDSARLAYRLEHDRRLAEERLKEKIKADLRRATECSIPLLIARVRCPSRRETAVAVLIIDGVVRLAGK